MWFHGEFSQDASLKKSTFAVFNILTYRYVTIFLLYE